MPTARIQRRYTRLSTALLSALLPVVLAAPCGTWADTAPDLAEALENRFNDPFFQFTFAVADCPQPLGPRVTLAQQRAQTHVRAEKGSSCWLAGRCERSNSYAYDADIGTALQQAVKPGQLYTHSPLVNSSLWMTVQARTVTVEGCVAGDVPTGFDHDFIARHLEVLVRSVPNVQTAIVRIHTSAQARAGQAVPYPTLRP